MLHHHRNDSLRLLIALSFIFGVAECVPSLLAQNQVNSSLAALSVSGTGRVNAAGAVLPTTSQVSPPPVGNAPIYFHRAAARAGLRIEMQGTPGRPIILATGAIAGVPVQVGSDYLHLLTAGAQVIVDGTSPTSLLNFGAVIGPKGSWYVDLPSGLPFPFANTHLQGIVIDPTAPPFGIRMTGAVTIEVRPDIETLMRNTIDGLHQILSNPSYLPTCLSGNFNLSGLDATAAVISSATDALGLTDEVPTARRLMGIGANATNLTALPAGAPTIGQSVDFYADFASDYLPLFGVAARGDVERVYSLRVVENLGAWKFAGNQRDAEVSVELTMRPGASNPAGVDVFLNIDAAAPITASRQMTAVTVTGPQLANVVSPSLPTATSTTVGSYVLTPGVHGDGQELAVSIRLAVSSAGNSRFPWVELPFGPRDVYSLTVAWDDGSTSGPYSLPLRAAIDVDASPVAVLSAIPGATQSGTLSGGGTSGAILSLSFTPGTLPGNSLYSNSDCYVAQNGLDRDADLLRVAAAPTTAMISIPFPGFVSGISTLVVLENRDIFGTHYERLTSSSY